jgi:carboxyvinyl-carboxyphosphonate phosphorylmutase
MDRPAQLRRIIERHRTLLVPGCYDALSAKILEQAGFPVIYMSGSAVTMSLAGLPDLGFLSMTEMVDRARYICAAIDRPLICDADTGYGGTLNVMRTIREYERAGVSGVHLEDQETPKRCGHFEGKRLISRGEMTAKLKAALKARHNPKFLIIARTDARAVSGLDEALNRATLYAQAGADMIFLEAPRSREELEIISRELRGIDLLINVVEGGKTPQLSFRELEDLGFRIVLYPTFSMRAVARTLQEVASHLKERGDTLEIADRLVSFEGRNRITGLKEFQEIEAHFSIDDLY